MSSNQIYSAKYSGVDVYEFIHPTGSIMKRKADDWVNATHILKAAKFAKAKRTRILEKEVIKDIHEKVQGGFGKYQGTWVPLDIARKLAVKFDVLDELRPLFDFRQVEGSASPPQAPKHHHASRSDSTKKRAAKGGLVTKSKNSESSSSSSTPTVPKRRGRPPSNKNKKAAANLQRSQSDMVFPRPAIPVSNISSTKLPSIQSPLQRTISLDPVIMRESGVSQPFKELDIEDGLSSDIEPSRGVKHQHEGSSSSSLPTSPSGLSEDNTFDQRTIGGTIDQDELGSATSPVSAMIPRFPTQTSSQSSENNSKVSEYLSRLVEYFVSSESHSDYNVPEEILYPPANSAPYIDAWIDHEQHTAFHWSCAMGNIAIVEALHNAGASIRSVNAQGENPLMRCSIFHNSFTRRTYPRIFQLLHDTVFDVDSQLQTVVHHIVRRKSSTPSAVYYLDILLSKLKDFSPQYRIECLINAQDQQGDTALHIAAQNGDKVFFQTLVQHGGLLTIKNNQGLTPTELMNLNYTSSQHPGMTNGKPKSSLPPSSPSEFLMYPSQAATRLSRGIPEVVNLMKEIADSYNRLHQARDIDARNLEKTYLSMSKTISTVEFKIMEVLGLEDLSDVDSVLEKKNSDLNALRSNLVSLRKDLINRLERSQSKQLAQFIQEEEIKLSPNSKDQETDRMKQVTLALELAQLQIRRKKKMTEILEVIADNAKIHKYRKMISQGTEMDIEEVDGSLDIILQSLNSE
ncbi:LAFE_0E07426g1_1 [Lachancea fermentati]|uniref:Transcription factor MBP1 n=1 Tax=Lachancea fermentati TaxID=4955 RepID=A0A1G4MDE7_LACFM|nr:LAFE_0E07426g1_1 [Lachancea fermentati]